jgi:hypothetical protein
LASLGGQAGHTFADRNFLDARQKLIRNVSAGAQMKHLRLGSQAVDGACVACEKIQDPIQDGLKVGLGRSDLPQASFDYSKEGR